MESTKDIFDFLDDGVEESSGFQITDDVIADWAVKKIRAAYEERDRLNDIADREKAIIDDKKQELNRRCENSVSFLRSKLAEYFETVEHKKTKTQESYALLSGKLIRKHINPKYSYDDAELLKYLKESAPNMVEVKEKAKWGEFKKRTKLTDDGSVIDTETGEVLGFINIEQQPDVFDIKF